jgi:acylphosphatase
VSDEDAVFAEGPVRVTAWARGRVQGVGFRWWTRARALELGLSGWALNLDDGRVEVYAVGPIERLNDLAGLLRQGPRWADVRGVEEREEPVVKYSGFHIER